MMILSFKYKCKSNPNENSNEIEKSTTFQMFPRFLFYFVSIEVELTHIFSRFFWKNRQKELHLLLMKLHWIIKKFK